MSPNIIQIKHIEGLTQSIVDEIFDCIKFYKISPPLTPKGVWKLYLANRDDYLLLLSRPYLFGDTLFDQIYLYSRSEKLSTSEQIMKAISEISHFHITNCKHEDGKLFIFDIYFRSNHSINNIASNFLVNSYTTNIPHVGDENITNQDEIGSKTNGSFRPKNFQMFKKMINKEQEIYRIFNGIPIESIYQMFNGEWRVLFKAENFQDARFRLYPSTTKIDHLPEKEVVFILNLNVNYEIHFCHNIIHKEALNEQAFREVIYQLMEWVINNTYFIIPKAHHHCQFILFLIDREYADLLLQIKEADYQDEIFHEYEVP
ncbi:hypothetical protein RF11_01196 [Thelohanellus kitauei]|uniref:Uncharacterized protein n=1 Tax=Thelohanellus kitauei TaxID=669202 RepID=A0A0C2N6N6_THEKT|nr:hypothetical protein RF11_01196 [Thelohanellus kitauei]